MGWNEDYNDVPSRIREFRAKYPDGCLQSEVWQVPFEGFIAVKAYAYRTPDDQRPGVGYAWEPVPGKTNFTRDSELQNAETSAWGRAIVAVGAADTKKGIASAEDVRNRSSEETPARGRSSESPAGNGHPAGSTSGDVRVTSSRPTATSPETSVPSTSGAEGGGTGSSGGGEGGSVDGEAAGSPEPPSDLIELLLKAYPNRAHALRAANKRFGVKSLDELGPAAITTLVQEKPADATA
jgi:hypothetical protein